MAELFYGTVKFYDSTKRFGFIGRDHPGAADVFVGDCGPRKATPRSSKSCASRTSSPNRIT
jgi:hypothetical protein